MSELTKDEDGGTRQTGMDGSESSGKIQAARRTDQMKWAQETDPFKWGGHSTEEETQRLRRSTQEGDNEPRRVRDILTTRQDVNTDKVTLASNQMEDGDKEMSEKPGTGRRKTETGRLGCSDRPRGR